MTLIHQLQALVDRAIGKAARWIHVQHILVHILVRKHLGALLLGSCAEGWASSLKSVAMKSVSTRALRDCCIAYTCTGF